MNNKNKTSATANAAIFATYKSNEQAIEDVCFYIENNLSDIIQLPELFFIADKSITHDAGQLAKIAQLCEQLIVQISQQLRDFQYVCTSLVIDNVHQAVIINKHGLFASQRPLTFCQRYSWTLLGEHLKTIELPLEQGCINIVMLSADDANIPETFVGIDWNNIHVILSPFDIQAPDAIEQALLSHAAQHKVCVVAATREKSFEDNAISNSSHIASKNNAKIKSKKSTGFIANLTAEPSLEKVTNSQNLNDDFPQLIVKHQYGKITKAVIHPIHGSAKLKL